MFLSNYLLLNLPRLENYQDSKCTENIARNVINSISKIRNKLKKHNYQSITVEY